MMFLLIDCYQFFVACKFFSTIFCGKNIPINLFTSLDVIVMIKKMLLQINKNTCGNFLSKLWFFCVFQRFFVIS